MRIHGELQDAFAELEDAIDAVRPLVTRRQFRRLQDAAEAFRVIIGLLDDDRPAHEPPTEDASN